MRPGELRERWRRGGPAPAGRGPGPAAGPRVGRARPLARAVRAVLGPLGRPAGGAAAGWGCGAKAAPHRMSCFAAFLPFLASERRRPTTALPCACLLPARPPAQANAQGVVANANGSEYHASTLLSSLIIVFGLHRPLASLKTPPNPCPTFGCLVMIGTGQVIQRSRYQGHTRMLTAGPAKAAACARLVGCVRDGLQGAQCGLGWLSAHQCSGHSCGLTNPNSKLSCWLLYHVEWWRDVDRCCLFPVGTMRRDSEV